MRRAGRAVRPRIRRPARQPLLRRRAGFAHVLRARPDRPAAFARRLSGACAGKSASATCRCFRAPRCSTSSSSTATRKASSCATWSPAKFPRTPPTPWCWPPAATATFFISRPTPKAATSPPPGARTRKARSSPIPATRRFIRPASPSAASISPKLTLMSESLRNDGRVWVPKRKEDCGKAPAGHSRSGPRLLPRTKISQLRQPRPARHFLARGQGSLRRRPRRRPRRTGRLSRFCRRHQAARRGQNSRALRQSFRHV